MPETALSTTEPAPKPWERQPHESRPRFEAFSIYRDMQARTISKAAGIVGKSVRLLETWSAEDSWVRRADAWDAEADRMISDQLQKNYLKSRMRLITFANVIYSKVREALPSFDFEALGPVGCARMLALAEQLERAGFGEYVNESPAQAERRRFADIEFGLMTNDQLERFESLARDVEHETDRVFGPGGGGGKVRREPARSVVEDEDEGSDGD